jgi:16S rRNA (adenine1518-N6/adenine1519-N6)-dimethyltransferase
MYLLESGIPFRSITVMVQKEVADRLCAPAGSPMYGAVTASVSYYGKAKRLFVVNAGNFMPAPKVDSAVVRIDLFKTPPVECDFKTLMRVIKGAFGQRRKTLLNALSTEFSHVSKDNMAKAIENAGFSVNIRGEKLSLEDFSKVANAILDLR